ncbi:MAG: hypothetical protein ABJN57_09160 [Hyphomicrobiales bacterium]
MTLKNHEAWEWIPHVGLGPFKYETSVQEYMSEFDLILEKEENKKDYDWDTYNIIGTDKCIWTEDDIIMSIRCDDQFNYNEKNLIGMTEDELFSHMKGQSYEMGIDVLYDDGTQQTPFEYNDLGLSVWTENRIVVSASAYQAID